MNSNQRKITFDDIMNRAVFMLGLKAATEIFASIDRMNLSDKEKELNFSMLAHMAIANQCREVVTICEKELGKKAVTLKSLSVSRKQNGRS